MPTNPNALSSMLDMLKIYIQCTLYVLVHGNAFDLQKQLVILTWLR